MRERDAHKQCHNPTQFKFKFAALTLVASPVEALALLEADDLFEDLECVNAALFFLQLGRCSILLLGR